MKIYVIKNEHEIYGLYKHEKTAEFVRDNINSQLNSGSSNKSLFYYIEAFELRDDY